MVCAPDTGSMRSDECTCDGESTGEVVPFAGFDGESCSRAAHLFPAFANILVLARSSQHTCDTGSTVAPRRAETSCIRASTSCTSSGLRVCSSRNVQGSSTRRMSISPDRLTEISRPDKPELKSRSAASSHGVAASLSWSVPAPVGSGMKAWIHYNEDMT